VSNLLAALIVSVALAAISAITVARRRSDYRPAAVALVLLATANVLYVVFYQALSPPQAEPWTGWRRWIVYLDGANRLLSEAAVAGLALAVTSERPRRVAGAVFGVWLLASIVLAALYPSPLVRGESLGRIYLAADLFGLFIAFGAIGSWAFLRRTPRPAMFVALLLTLIDLGVLITPHSPWRGAIISGRYDVVQVMLVVLFVSLTLTQGVLWKFSKR
jgi:hypothetical protein